MSTAKDLVAIFVPIIALLVAFAGLTTWRRQLDGAANRDLARRILTGVYKMREAINDVRGPIMVGEEMDAGLQLSGRLLKDIPESERHYVGMRGGYAFRMRAFADRRSECKALMLEAEALWGDGWRDVLSELDSLAMKLYAAVEQVVESNHPLQPRRTDSAELKDLRGIIYKLGHDEFSVSYDAAVSKIEDAVRPHLPSPQIPWWMLWKAR